MSDDFAEHPESLTEHKARKTELAIHWTPRDALIAALRAIDSGEYQNVDTMVLCFRENDPKDDGTRTRFINCGPDIQTSIGTIEIVKQQLYNGV